MSYDFNANDIFKMAIEIEKNGLQFYKKAANNFVLNSKENTILSKLAAMETEHIVIFKNIKKQLTKLEIANTIFDPENEANLYLKSLVQNENFFEKEINTSSINSIIKTAIELEKNSILFYVEMQRLIPEKLGQDKITKIIDEEINHIKIITTSLQNI